MKKLTLFLLFIVYINQIFAQNNDSTLNLKTKKVIIIKKNNTSEIETPKFIIKISPFSLIKGEIPIHFEKSFTKKLSFEISPFFTVKELRLDYLFLEQKDEFLLPFNNSNYRDDFKYINSNIKTGFGFRGELRVYPDKVFEGFYFGIAASSKKHYVFSDIQNNFNGNVIATNQNFSYSSSDLRITFGKQSTFIDENNVFIEWAFGIGTRTYSASNYPSLKKISFTQNYEIGYNNFKIVSLAIFANIKIGFTL